jgi:3-methyladenine DNA glycosylase AlkD
MSPSSTATVTLDEVMQKLDSFADPVGRAGMARFGIETSRALGIKITQLRPLARTLGKSHELAADLWATGIHEARLLATMVDDPKAVSEQQMEEWAAEFNSWDLVDQCCGNLFDKTEFGCRKAYEWTERDEEFVKRAGFALIAYLAIHAKKTPDTEIERFLPVIERESDDDRNFVKKAVNWALRQIGKRSLYLHPHAVACAERIAQRDSKAARWIARDALRELQSDAVITRLETWAAKTSQMRRAPKRYS